LGLPLSRLSSAEIARQAVKQGMVAQLSGATVWRWLSADAIRPWRHRSWIFPRDPQFAEKAGVILDWYQRRWQGKRLKDGDYVLSTDEKTSIQARARSHPTTPPKGGQRMRLEHEYEREGALAYLAAWDVGRAKLFGRCEASTGNVTVFMKRSTKEVVPALVATLKDQDALVDKFKDQDTNVRRFAAEALGQIATEVFDTKSKETLPQLRMAYEEMRGNWRRRESRGRWALASIPAAARVSGRGD